jgi:hypothetical protein
LNLNALDEVLQSPVTKSSSRLIELRARITGEYETFENFDRRVNRELDKVIQLIENKKESYADFGEEALTNVIQVGLAMADFDAQCGTTINGEVDLVVRHGPLEWILEAKIFTSYIAAVEGMLQLATRYSTGNDYNTHGAVLLYIKAGDLYGKLKELRNRYALGIVDSKGDKIFKNMRCKDCNLSRLSFITEHEHYSSGLPYTVRHRGVSLLFDPQDTSGKKRQKPSTLEPFDEQFPESLPPWQESTFDRRGHDGWLTELITQQKN